MKNIILFAVVLAFVLLNGSVAASAVENSAIDYNTFYDTNGEYRLVGRNNDVWIEKIDGSEKRQITHTPSVREDEAYFVMGSKYIVFGKINYSQAYLSKVYLVAFDKDDTAKKEITMQEAKSLVNSSRR